MAKLIIKRTSEWYNKMRDFKIYVDQSKIGRVENGETVEFELEAGIHKLNTKIDWCSSKTIEFEIKENETKKVELSSFKYSKLIAPILLVILIFYVVAKIEFSTDLNFLSIIGNYYLLLSFIFFDFREK